MTTFTVWNVCGGGKNQKEMSCEVVGVAVLGCTPHKSTTTRSGRGSRDLFVCSCQKRRRRRRLSVCVCSPPQPPSTYRMLVSRTVSSQIWAPPPAPRSPLVGRTSRALRLAPPTFLPHFVIYLPPPNQRSVSVVAHSLPPSLPPSSVGLLFYCSVSVTQSCVRKLVI